MESTTHKTHFVLGNDISLLLPQSFSGLEGSLETLELADNSLTHLPSDAFTGLPHLSTIDLSGNNLRQIDPSVFRDGMDGLTNLILADNMLKSIPYQALAPLRKLSMLDLSYNLIDEVEPSAVSGDILNVQMNLDLLNLEFNQIGSLQTNSFKNFQTVNKTYLDGNMLSVVEVRQ